MIDISKVYFHLFSLFKHQKLGKFQPRDIKHKKLLLMDKEEFKKDEDIKQRFKTLLEIYIFQIDMDSTLRSCLLCKSLLFEK